MRTLLPRAIAIVIAALAAVAAGMGACSNGSQSCTSGKLTVSTQLWYGTQQADRVTFTSLSPSGLDISQSVPYAQGSTLAFNTDLTFPHGYPGADAVVTILVQAYLGASVVGQDTVTVHLGDKCSFAVAEVRIQPPDSSGD
jgi:hypothetical protein